MNDAQTKTPGRRELSQDRRRTRRTHRLRIGAAVAAGSLALFGVAGATMQHDELRAGLASLTSPLAGADNDGGPSDAGADSTSDAASTDDAERAAQDEAAAAAAEQAKAEDAGREAEAAEAAAIAEAAAADQAAAEERAAEEQVEHAAQAEAEAARAAAAEAVAAEARVAEAAAVAAAPVAVDDPAAAKAYAASALSGRGWAASEMTCLNTLWEKESNWMTSATNASSGAYGIVQSLPAEKMASSGADYLTNYQTQINWGLDYIESRYGSPCSALNFHYANNWY